MTQSHKYNFLHFATKELSLTCSKQSPRKQMALRVSTSECHSEQNSYMYAVANNIPPLSDGCLIVVYDFIAMTDSTSDIRNYHEFIYKGRPKGYMTTGHELFVSYGFCPQECKTFKYSLFVSSPKRAAIIEHTAHLGNTTFTGYFHNGFLGKIIEPKNHCQAQLCHLKLSIQKPPHAIGIKKNSGYLHKR